MKKYFYTDGTNKFGPFTPDELKAKNLSLETRVWFEGMPDWKPAKDVPELEGIFVVAPPPIAGAPAKVGNTVEISKAPKSYLAESILVTIFCCWPFGIPAIVNAAKVEKLHSAGDPDGSFQASENAKKWCLVSLIVGIVVVIIYVVALFGFGLYDELEYYF